MKRAQPGFAPIAAQPLAEARSPYTGDLRRHFGSRDKKGAIELPSKGSPGAILLKGGGAYRKVVLRRCEPCQRMFDLGSDVIREFHA